MNQAPGIPTLDDMHAARERIAPYLSPTPLYPYPDLSELVGTEIWVKHEKTNPSVPSKSAEASAPKGTATFVSSFVLVDST